MKLALMVSLIVSISTITMFLTAFVLEKSDIFDSWFEYVVETTYVLFILSAGVTIALSGINIALHVGG